MSILSSSVGGVNLLHVYGIRIYLRAGGKSHPPCLHTWPGSHVILPVTTADNTIVSLTGLMCTCFVVVENYLSFILPLHRV